MEEESTGARKCEEEGCGRPAQTWVGGQWLCMWCLKQLDAANQGLSDIEINDDPRP